MMARARNAGTSGSPMRAQIETPISRRRWLHIATAATATTLLHPRASADRDTIVAGLVIPANHPSTSSVRAGAILGAAEAERVASLMNKNFRLVTIQLQNPANPLRAVSEMRNSGASTIFGGVSQELCDALAADAPELFLEIRARSELDPHAAPIQHLALNPDYQTYQHALQKISLSKNMEAGVTLPPAPNRAVPVAWHHSLKKYGAAQLNARFKTATARDMDEDAWFGWLAVKLIVEAALRNQPLAKILTDGHKGAPLHFETSRLEQPLYVLLHAGEASEVLDA